MTTTFVTSNGSVVTCNRIDRRLLDALWVNEMPPQPPVSQVEVWGGIFEDVHHYDDENYLISMGLYRLKIEDRIIALFKDVTEYQASKDDQTEADELAALSSVDFFRDVILADENDRNQYINTCVYLSTVTEIGIQDALRKFNVTYMGKPILELSMPGSYAERFQVFEDRQAARYGKISWQQFCELSGPEQSEYVAFMRADQAVKIRQTLEERKK